MREMKFRFWDTVVESWCIDGKSETNIYDFAFRENMNWTYITKKEAKERIIVEQFTGIKDKNGKEIYEGDLVIHFGETMEVVNRHGCFYHKHLKDEAYGSLHSINYPYAPLEDNIYYEIIGNVHESTSKPV